MLLPGGVAVTDSLSARYARWIGNHSKFVIISVLLVTALVAAGAVVTDTGDEAIGQFDVDSPETAASEEIAATYGTDDGLVSQLVVREEGGDVLTRKSLLAGLELQRELRADGEIDATLEEPGLVGIENVVGTVGALEDGRSPDLDGQYDAIESRSTQEVERLIERSLDPDRELPGDVDPYELLPRGYEPGSTTADARMTLIFQADESGEDERPQAAYDAQVAIADRAGDTFEDSFVFGQGITDDASNRAVGDSFAIITPVALVLVLFILGISYRDVLDILIALFGIATVMVWLAGMMGWLAIPMNQILIAVPFLLIGLSIDYALHVVMRYREAREGELDRVEYDRVDATEEKGANYPLEKESARERRSDGTPAVGVRAGMVLGLSGVVLALAAATVSTGVGFLSNVVSPLPAIQDFAVLSGVGILATFVVFGIFIPAVKIEIDGFVENRLGRSRRKSAFGVGAGQVNAVLSRLATLSNRIPYLIIGIALLLAAGGLVGATTIDTEFNEADFLPEDAPEWTGYLPGALQPDSYTVKADLTYLSENFQLRGQGNNAEILIRGDVTDPALLSTLDGAQRGVGEDSSITLRADGLAAIDGPHTMLRSVAAENETVRAAIEENDHTGNGLPDENVGAVFDRAYEADSDTAGAVLFREEGNYESARLVVGVRGDASAQRVATDVRAFAAELEDGAAVTAIATGGPVTSAVVQDALLETLVQAFAVTLVVILVFLTVLYWVRYRSPSLAVVTLLPVLIALAWLLGAMALRDIPFNSETAVITSLAIGLGVDYSIHATERFVVEDEVHDTMAATLDATLTGTGGALLASAATTATGFGVLALALAPPLQRFGVVTGVSIAFALLACLTVLPCLLVLRERLLRRLA